MICYMNNLIQHGRWGVCDSITMHAPIFAMYVGPTKVKEIKLSTLSLLRSCFLTKQNDGVLRWPFKLYLTADVLLKVRLTHSMPLRPNKCIFLAFYVPSQIFLWEFQSPPPPSNKLTQPPTGMTKDIIMFKVFHELHTIKICNVRGTNLNLLRSRFSTKQSDGVLAWPLKLFNCRCSKVCLTRSIPLHPNGCIFSAFYVPSQTFLWIPQGSCLVRTLFTYMIVLNDTIISEMTASGDL